MNTSLEAKFTFMAWNLQIMSSQRIASALFITQALFIGVYFIYVMGRQN